MSDQFDGDDRRNLYLKVGAAVVGVLIVIGLILFVIKPWGPHDPYAWITEQCKLDGRPYVQTHPEVPSLVLGIDLSSPGISTASHAEEKCLLSAVGVHPDAFATASTQLEKQIRESANDGERPFGSSSMTTTLAKVTLFWA